jgi:hypothetical protein
MHGKEKRVTPQELIALGVGLTVTIASAVLTSPIAFPFNFLISLGLGGTAGYGTLKVLDPRTLQDLLDLQTSTEYRQLLHKIEGIAGRTDEASQSLGPISPEVSGRVGNIARMTRMILERYKVRRRDFAGASATLLILQKFDGILAHYLKVKRGELFLDKEQREVEIAQAETHDIPMTEIALENLGKKLDAGEVLDKGLSSGTLESMLRSLNLIEDLRDEIGSSSKEGESREEGDSDDQNT